MSDFSELCILHFAFLTTNFGFKPKEVSDERVVYESESAFIQIGLGRRGEVGLVFDRCPPIIYYPFGFYLKIYFPDMAARLQEHTAKSRLELDVSILELARLLEIYGKPIMTGQTEVFAEMASKAAEILDG